MIKIDYEKCCWKDGACKSCSCSSGTSCKGCVEACPVQAITRKKVLEIDETKCINCGACVLACPKKALKIY